MCHRHFTNGVGLKALAARAMALLGTATCSLLFGTFW